MPSTTIVGLGQVSNNGYDIVTKTCRQAVKNIVAKWAHDKIPHHTSFPTCIYVYVCCLRHSITVLGLGQVFNKEKHWLVCLSFEPCCHKDMSGSEMKKWDHGKNTPSNTIFHMYLCIWMLFEAFQHNGRPWSSLRQRKKMTGIWYVWVKLSPRRVTRQWKIFWQSELLI